MRDLDRNVSLGAELLQREGSEQELAELQRLAEAGLKQARDRVARDPRSAEAWYLLGSWLIYGYRVVESQETTTIKGETLRETVRRAKLGLKDDPTEGLEALHRAMELAPGHLDYTLDYAAALLDTHYALQARGVLHTLWAGKQPLTPAQKVRAAVMLSDTYLGEQRFTDAREWLYTALAQNPENAEIVRRLRALDAEAAAARPPAPPAAPEVEEVVPAPAPEAEEEAVPESEAGEEIAPEAEEEQTEEMAPKEPTESPEEYAPESEEEGQGESELEGTEGSGDTSTWPEAEDQEAGY
jgi:hypothetical protein